MCCVPADGREKTRCRIQYAPNGRARALPEKCREIGTFKPASAFRAPPGQARVLSPRDVPHRKPGSPEGDSFAFMPWRT